MTLEKVHKNLTLLNRGVKKAFAVVKEEMECHLDTINQNTNEIQACYEYLTELDAKIEKITERLDELEGIINPDANFLRKEIKLTLREQEVFMTLYVEEKPLTSIEIARRTGLTVEMVEEYLEKMIKKEVPIKREFVKGKVELRIDEKFKELQMRKNILQIDEAIAEQIMANTIRRT